MDSQFQVLIIEDEELILELFIQELSKEDFQVFTCKTIQEALKILSAVDVAIDFCIVDHDLPDGNGLDLMAQIKVLHSEIPVIFISGHGSPSILESAMHDGAFDYIEKPFSVAKDVLPIIKRLVSTLLLKKENSYLNNQILHSSKLAALGELSATVVHDIRGPLAMIQLTCEDLAEECAQKNSLDLPTLQQHLGQIGKACSRIKKLVDHLRNYSRDDADEMEESKKLTEIIEDSLFLVEQKLRKLGIKASTEIEEGLQTALLTCYPNKFEQVLMNLMSNACDAMQNSDKKELSIKALVVNGFLRVSIMDTGSGIKENILPKIFESFFTTKSKQEGTGLGLSIVKNIVKEHGGDLLVESKYGKGSTFTVQICASKLTYSNL